MPDAATVLLDRNAITKIPLKIQYRMPAAINELSKAISSRDFFTHITRDRHWFRQPASVHYSIYMGLSINHNQQTMQHEIVWIDKYVEQTK